MTWFDDGDGWRDESTEGPYDELRTMYPWQIYRGLPWERETDAYELTNAKEPEFKMWFPTVAKAKEWVKDRQWRL